MLAAMSYGICCLNGVLFSDDSRAFIDCLYKLGFDIEVNVERRQVVIKGENGRIPNKKATINVNSAGTAARFLTVLLSVCGGDYILNSSKQMKRRPMEQLLDSLRSKGIRIKCLEKEGHFPFQIHSDGIAQTDISIDTTKSSQYASAFLMAGAVNGMNIKLTGSRINGAYINITLNMLKQFGVDFSKEDNTYIIKPQSFIKENYDIEPDVSAACYFYAMALILRTKVKVRGIHIDSMQGDIKFIKLLKDLGCTLSDTEEGIEVNGSHVEYFNGIDVDMSDFSDQALTMAVVAAFARTRTYIRNVAHIRGQESDRVQVIVTELNRLGCKAKIIENNNSTDILIEPGRLHGAEIETYEDHRVAMSFALVGLLVDDVVIKNPMCSKKTFENYFDVLEKIY